MRDAGEILTFSTTAAGGANCEILLNRRSDLSYLRFWPLWDCAPACAGEVQPGQAPDLGI